MKEHVSVTNVLVMHPIGFGLVVFVGMHVMSFKSDRRSNVVCLQVTSPVQRDLQNRATTTAPFPTRTPALPA